MRFLILFLSIALLTNSVSAEKLPTDDISRQVPENGPIKCPDIKRVKYRGETIRYHKPVRVNETMRERLKKFEKIVAETAIELYGRAPRRIHHLGSYYCRRIRNWPTYISEHGLANAVDIAQFDFGRAPKSKRKKLPRHLRGYFKVRMEKHWTPKRKKYRIHAVFLQRIAERVIKEKLFRAVLGPSYPGHHNHFHFDLSPWTMIDVWKDDEERITEL